MIISFDEYEIDVSGSKSLLLHQVELEKELGVKTESLPREKWDTWDPTLISEVNQTKQQLFYKACFDLFEKYTGSVVMF